MLALTPAVVAAAPLALSQAPATQDDGATISSLTADSRSVREPGTVFQASYVAADWRGQVEAFELAASADKSAPASAWGAVPGRSPQVPASTATLLDAPAFDPTTRVVLSARSGVGIDWRWNRLSVAQQAALSTIEGHVDALGEQRLAYLRGERVDDDAATGHLFRARRSRQGDIVNSRPWFHRGAPGEGHRDADYRAFQAAQAARPAMLYVGGNDGMLHGFAADTGAERLAYVPEGMHPHLAELTRPDYEHRYYVDGSPLVGDVRPEGRWRTYLAGFLGAGGRGYFMLDVTDPAQFRSSAPAELVVLDTTARATPDPDVGHIFAAPVPSADNPSTTRQLTRLNDGRWALVMGNGYNSESERAVLLVQYLDGARELRKLPVRDAADTSNGLGAPRLVDLDCDRIPDVAYAGDLAGRFWRFDLLGSDPAGGATPWGVAFDGRPLFTATDARGQVQPITAAPAWLAHPRGGLMLVFGTGRNLTDADRASTATQSIYGLHDTLLALPANGPGSVAPPRAPGTPITAGRAALVEQTIGAVPVGIGQASGARLWTISSRPIDYAASPAPRGWFVDLPEPGERVLANASRFDGQLLDVASMVPRTCAVAATACQPGPTAVRQYLNTLNGIDGSAPRSQLYAYVPAASDVQPAAGMTGTTGTASRIESGLRLGLKRESRERAVCPPGAPCEDRVRPGRIALRPSWRLLH